MAETVARFPRVTVEWGAWWWGVHEAECRWLDGTMRQAGFPLCATEQALRDIPDIKRLPECEAERARAAAPRT